MSIQDKIEALAAECAEDEHKWYELMDKMLKALIQKTLVKTRGNQSKASRIIGINRETLRSRLTEEGFKVKRSQRYKRK